MHVQREVPCMYKGECRENPPLTVDGEQVVGHVEEGPEGVDEVGHVRPRLTEARGSAGRVRRPGSRRYGCSDQNETNSFMGELPA